MQARRKVWNPRNKAQPVKVKDLNATAKRLKEAQFEFNADGALSEVIRMAEGYGNLTLGREALVNGDR